MNIYKIFKIRCKTVLRKFNKPEKLKTGISKVCQNRKPIVLNLPVLHALISSPPSYYFLAVICNWTGIRSCGSILKKMVAFQIFQIGRFIIPSLFRKVLNPRLNPKVTQSHRVERDHTRQNWRTKRKLCAVDRERVKDRGVH